MHLLYEHQSYFHYYKNIIELGMKLYKPFYLTWVNLIDNLVLGSWWCGQMTWLLYSNNMPWLNEGNSWIIWLTENMLPSSDLDLARECTYIKWQVNICSHNLLSCLSTWLEVTWKKRKLVPCSTSLSFSILYPNKVRAAIKHKIESCAFLSATMWGRYLTVGKQISVAFASWTSKQLLLLQNHYRTWNEIV